MCCIIIPTSFPKEQLDKCKACKYASKKIRWCGNHGIRIPYINEQPKKLIVPGRPISYPTTGTMVKSFVKSLGQHTRSGFKARSRIEQDKCLAICKLCTEYVARTAVGPRCQKCGCNMNLKVRWASNHCPLDKW